MVSLILRRLAITPLVLLGVTFAVQALYLLLPGDPAMILAGGDSASLSEIERIRAELHLDEPIYIQYWYWLSDTLRGDFGDSLVTGEPVVEEIMRRLPITLGLGLTAYFLALPLGFVGGVATAVRRGGKLDRFMLAVTTAGMAIPAFIVGILIVMIFSIQFRLLPATGYVHITESLGGWASHVILPASALAIHTIARLMRTLRSSLIETMDGAYILTAWSKGATPSGVLMTHSLKNSLIPVVTVLGLEASQIIGGAVIIENVFAIPGVGKYVADAAIVADMPVVQACTVLFAVVTVVVTLLVDVSYGLLNPKVRTSS